MSDAPISRETLEELARASQEYRKSRKPGDEVEFVEVAMSEFESLLDETLAVGMGDEYFQPWSKGLEAARAALLAYHERVVQERDNAESALLRHGYRKSCDIPACNCGDQWNHGGNAADRLREISDEVYENGKTILASVRGLKAALAERDARIAHLQSSMNLRDEQIAELEAQLDGADRTDPPTGGYFTVGEPFPEALRDALAKSSSENG